MAEFETKRPASIAQVGGFRPPEDPLTSWIGKGVGGSNETLPIYQGKEMIPLLQINVTELPFVPHELAETKLLVVFFNQDDLPFDEPHGEGWLIREYQSLEDLVPLPKIDLKDILRPFPIKWSLAEESRRQRSISTKVGGFPDEIQDPPELENYVFQIGSEEKAGWVWADSGSAYFYKSPAGVWSWDCQFF